MRVRPTSTRVLVWVFLSLASISFLATLGLAFQFIQIPLYSKWELVTLMILKSTWECLPLFLIIHWRMRKCEVTFTRRFIEWRTLFGCKKHVNWFEVEEIRVSEKFGEIQIHRIEGRPAKIPRDALGGTLSPASIAHFVREYWSHLLDRVRYDPKRVETIRLHALENEPVLKIFWKSRA